MIINKYNKISDKLKEFIQKVSKDYGLEEWKLDFWIIKGENECISDIKLIYLFDYGNDETIKKWFLHEVSHALLSNNEDNRNHRLEWRNKFKELNNKYMVLI